VQPPLLNKAASDRASSNVRVRGIVCISYSSFGLKKGILVGDKGKQPRSAMVAPQFGANRCSSSRLCDLSRRTFSRSGPLSERFQYRLKIDSTVIKALVTWSLPLRRRPFRAWRTGRAGRKFLCFRVSRSPHCLHSHLLCLLVFW
jgi:hypothetical protein